MNSGPIDKNKYTESIQEKIEARLLRYSAKDKGKNNSPPQKVTTAKQSVLYNNKDPKTIIHDKIIIKNNIKSKNFTDSIEEKASDIHTNRTPSSSYKKARNSVH